MLGRYLWHEHKNMEIFGYVVEGSSHHVDSLGHDVEVPQVQFNE
jgi:redox-sensitive bicupin YhaK (pirin superfamily)